MILDRLENADLYRPLSKGIDQALTYLAETDLLNQPLGRYDLDGDEVYAMVQQYETKTDLPVIWESHRKYIDVQYVAKGRERLGYMPLSSQPQVTKPYDESIDAALYESTGDLVQFAAGSFSILWPGDVHAPGRAWADSSEEVLKVVVKVLVDA